MNNKLPSTVSEQIEKLRQRGCIINDEKLAEDTLKYINYFRFSNYFAPFEEAKGRYEEGTTFEKILTIYEMDRKLRSILIAALEEIEIALRAAVSNYHALKYGATGYLNPSTFDYRHNHQSFTSKIKYLIEANSDRDFVKHYLKKYHGVFPLWVITELFSFGTLAFFFKDMHAPDKKELAGTYYGCTGSELDNWIFCLNELRNCCAHYNRLYGNVFPLEPKTPKDMEYELKPDIFGYIMVMKQVYHNKANWNIRVVKPLKRLIDKNSEVIRLNDLGFPDGWSDEIAFKEEYCNREGEEDV